MENDMEWKVEPFNEITHQRARIAQNGIDQCCCASTEENRKTEALTNTKVKKKSKQNNNSEKKTNTIDR